MTADVAAPQLVFHPGVAGNCDGFWMCRIQAFIGAGREHHDNVEGADLGRFPGGIRAGTARTSRARETRGFIACGPSRLPRVRFLAIYPVA